MQPLGTGAGAVCCMCGDRGLPHELVRCKLCRVRLQHRYCSDLYPRATAYRRCNWCPRESTQAHAVPNKKTVASTETSASEEEEERQWLDAGCSTTRSKRSASRSRSIGSTIGQGCRRCRARRPRGTTATRSRCRRGSWRDRVGSR